jgi:hypothetical protein
MKTYFNDVVLRQLLSYTYHSDLGGHFVKQKIFSSDFQNTDTYRLREYSDYYNIETRSMPSPSQKYKYTRYTTYTISNYDMYPTESTKIHTLTGKGQGERIQRHSCDPLTSINTNIFGLSELGITEYSILTNTYYEANVFQEINSIVFAYNVLVNVYYYRKQNMKGQISSVSARVIVPDYQVCLLNTSMLTVC